jgi:hypothetical protein
VANVRALALFAFTGSTSAAMVLASGLGAASANGGPQSVPTASATAYAIIGTIPLGENGFAENPYVSDDDTVYVPMGSPANFVAVINPGTTSGQMDDSMPAQNPTAVGMSSDDTLFIAEFSNKRVLAFAPGSKTVAYSVSVHDFPRYLAVNKDDTMIVSSSNNSTGGSVSLIAPNADDTAANVLNIFNVDSAKKNPAGVTTDAAGNFYVGSSLGGTEVKFIASNATTVSRTITGLLRPESLGVGSDDSLYALNRDADRVDIIPSGETSPINSVVVGTQPVAMDIGPSGAIFTSNYGDPPGPTTSSISRVDPVTGASATILIGVPGTHGIVVTSTGVIYATTNVGIRNVVAAAEVSGGVSPTNAAAGAAVTLSLTTLPAGIVIDDSTVQSVWWGDDTVAFTPNAGTNTVSVNVPAGSGSVPIVLSLNGGNAITAGTFTYAAVPPPPPPVPASAPLDVAVVAGDSSADVSWQLPASSGSFLVTNYQVQSTPGSAGCLVPASSTACMIGALRNGSEYEVQVRALTGAGWGAWSDPVSVVPQPPAPVPSILISGSRDGRQVQVDGVTTGLVGERLAPWVRLRGQSGYARGADTRTVDADGEFTWQRRANKKVYVYFRAGDDVRSNRVIIPRSGA